MYRTHSDSTSSLKLISSTHSSLWLTTYLLCLVNPYFSTDSRYSYGDQLCSYSYRLVSVFVRGRLHAGTSQEKRKEASTLISPTAKQFYVPWFCWSYLSNGTWSKGYHRYSWVCFMPYPTFRNSQWRPIKNRTLRQKRSFQFCIYMYM